MVLEHINMKYFLFALFSLLLRLATAQNTSTCPNPTGFGNAIILAPLPSSQNLRPNNVFLAANVLNRYINSNTLLPQASFASFCLDQCISYHPDPSAAPIPISGTQPLAYVSNRTGPCLSFIVNMGKPFPEDLNMGNTSTIPDDPNDNAARWYCIGFSQYLALDQSDFVPAEASGTFMYSLGVNRACDGRYRAF
ncbi:MAG: hypothetical protein Q9222_001933 [Ikaeria aurantiellina]